MSDISRFHDSEGWKIIEADTPASVVPQPDGQWRYAGPIAVENGMISLPPLPDEPGLYRITLDDNAVYIGEAGDIKRRVGDYVRYYASVGIESEFRIHNAILKSTKAEIEVLTGGEFASRSQRCVREHQEIKKVIGKKILNGGSLEERIAFLKKEIQRLEENLARQASAKEIENV